MVGVHYLLAVHTGTNVKENLVYYITYTSNILYYLTNRFDGIVSHFWSLAVEEQFYLIWPWFILYVRPRFLSLMIAIFLSFGVGFAIVVPGRSDLLTPICFIPFAIGALLACINFIKTELTFGQSVGLNDLALCSLLVLGFYPLIGEHTLKSLATTVPTSFVTFWFIHYCLVKNDNVILNIILQNSILVFIGKISYGIYVYHTIIPWLWTAFVDWLKNFGWDIHKLYSFIPSNFYSEMDLLVKLILLIVLSWISWVIIERPILSLKNKFQVKHGVHSNI
jgi:peptidoglycan/LPS O-acetylase OafA/YrhL